MAFFYTAGIRLYAFGIRIASLWNPKAKAWVKGRKNWTNQLKNYSPKENTYWFHCASLGEFEQGLPVMELLKKNGYDIVVSFFSPSGYEVKKNHPISDTIFYLPIDSKKNAAKLLAVIQPKTLVFVKYEFWANLILEAKNSGVQLALITGLFRPNQIFFKGYGGFMRKVLGAFDHILVQNDASVNLLESINLESVNLGDTRFDRVNANLSEPQSYPNIEGFINGKKILVLGSVWGDDMEVIGSTINKLNDEWKVLIAPHKIDEKNISTIASYLTSSSIYTDKIDSDKKVLIVNTMGMLQHLYRYGNLAYVGGGFKTGLHNILEPAVFGLPVIFGNKVEKFPEAERFVEAGIGIKISNKPEFDKAFEAFTAENYSERVQNFVQENLGAAERIFNTIK